MYNTPVLFIIFNKPEKTQLVFNQIKKVKPKYFYVAADAPRVGVESDVINCEKTRSIIKQIDWDCELKLLYRDENLGCGRGPSEAISWFFENVDEGLVIEDDCLPHLDFFEYAEQLLEKYRDYPQIMSIGGVNFQDGKSRSDGSYYFSKHNAIWGWASWKRVWKNYDYSISNISENDFLKIINDTFHTSKERRYWIDIFKNVKKDRLRDSAWDYQFMFMIWKMNGLAILPNKNLVSNIGFDSDATHTFDENNPCANIEVKSILPLKHPANIRQNIKADLYYYNKCLQVSKYSKHYFKRKLRNLIRKINKKKS